MSSTSIPISRCTPLSRVTTTLAADSFRRQSDRDGIYSPAGILLRSGLRSHAMHVGERASNQIEWHIDRHFSNAANYTHFFAGRFIRETGPSKDIEYTTPWLQYRF